VYFKNHPNSPRSVAELDKLKAPSPPPPVQKDSSKPQQNSQQEKEKTSKEQFAMLLQSKIFMLGLKPAKLGQEFMEHLVTLHGDKKDLNWATYVLPCLTITALLHFSDFGCSR